MMLDNGGVFVCKCRHLQLAGGGKVTSGGGGALGGGGLPGFMSPRLSSPAHHSQAGGGGGGGGGRGGGGGFRGRGRGRGNVGRDRELIGQTIKITQGPYKGHIGIVKVNNKYINSFKTIETPVFFGDPLFFINIII